MDGFLLWAWQCHLEAYSICHFIVSVKERNDRTFRQDSESEDKLMSLVVSRLANWVSSRSELIALEWMGSFIIVGLLWRVV